MVLIQILISEKIIFRIIVCWSVVKFVLNWEQNILFIKRWQLLCRQKASMLTALIVPSLACKYVFYRPEHNAKGFPMKLILQNWNIPTDWPQRVDENIYFQSYGYYNGSFCTFCWWQEKLSHSLGKIFKCIWKIWVFQKMVRLIGFGVTFR